MAGKQLYPNMKGGSPVFIFPEFEDLGCRLALTLGVWLEVAPHPWMI